MTLLYGFIFRSISGPPCLSQLPQRPTVSQDMTPSRAFLHKGDAVGHYDGFIRHYFGHEFGHYWGTMLGATPSSPPLPLPFPSPSPPLPPPSPFPPSHPKTCRADEASNLKPYWRRPQTGSNRPNITSVGDRSLQRFRLHQGGP